MPGEQIIRMGPFFRHSLPPERMVTLERSKTLDAIKALRLEQSGAELQIMRAFDQKQQGFRRHGLTDVESTFVPQIMERLATKALQWKIGASTRQAIPNQI